MYSVRFSIRAILPSGFHSGTAYTDITSQLQGHDMWLGDHCSQNDHEKSMMTTEVALGNNKKQAMKDEEIKFRVLTHEM